MLELDPFNVKQFGEKHSKWLKLVMLAVPALLLLSFLFFLLSFASSHDGEVSNVNYEIEVRHR